MDVSQSERRDYDNCPGNPKTIKSSVYAPVSLNLMGMYLIKEHMNAHYRRLYNVKATVDTSAPHSKSMQHLRTKSVSARRATPTVSSRLPISKSSQRKSVQSCCDEPDKRLMLESKIDRYLTSVHQEKPQIPEQLPIRPVRPSSSASQISRRTKISSTSQPARIKVSPDLLQRHQDYFTQPKEPFCPRTLISNSKSRLAESRVYYPPLRKTSNDAVTSQPVEEDQNKLPVENNNYSTVKRPVPALNIKRDSDHVRWLEEQARKMRAEKKLDELEQTLKAEGFEDFLNASYCCQRGGWKEEFTTEVKDSSHLPQSSYLPMKNEGNKIKTRPWTTGRNRRNLSFLDKNNRRNSDLDQNSWIHKQLKAEEEEKKYLDFIMEVTNDILIRGIYSDRALKQIFQYHMDRRAADLNVIKMKYMLDKLQEEMHIPQTERFSYHQKEAWKDFDVSNNQLSSEIVNTKYEHSEKPLESEIKQTTLSRNSFTNNENIQVSSVPVVSKSILPTTFNTDERTKFFDDDPLFYKNFDVNRENLWEQPTASSSNFKPNAEGLRDLDIIDAIGDLPAAEWNPLMDIDSRFTDLDLNSMLQSERKHSLTSNSTSVFKQSVDNNLQIDLDVPVDSRDFENNEPIDDNLEKNTEGISDSVSVKNPTASFGSSKSKSAFGESKLQHTDTYGEQKLTRQSTIETLPSSPIKEDFENISNRSSNQQPSKGDYSFNSFVADESSAQEVKSNDDDNIHSEASAESESRVKMTDNYDTNLDTEFSLSEDDKF